MSRFPSFLEYLNDKGSVVEKPGVEQVPDYRGPDDKTPPGSKVPYKTPMTPKAAQKGEKGLSELGDEKLVYKPDTAVEYETKKDVMKEAAAAKMGEKAKTDIKCDYKGPKSDAPKGGKPYVAKAVNPGNKPLGELGSDETKYEPDTDTSKGIERKTKTESFLNKTKDMSLSEFTKYMLKECGCGQVSGDDLPYVTAYTAGKFQPHPPEVIRYITTLADKNDGILENLVSTVISMGYLNKLLKAVFGHPQAYEELTSLFSDENDGPSRCKSFAGAMSNSYNKFLADQEGLYESVSGPMGFEDEEEQDDEEGMEDDEEGMEDDEEGMEDDEEGMEDDEEGMEDDEEGMEDDIEGHDDEEVMGDDTEGDHDIEGMKDDMEGDHDMEGMEDDMPKPRKLRKKFAHHHLLDAMKGHENMFKAMRGI